MPVNLDKNSDKEIYDYYFPVFRDVTQPISDRAESAYEAYYGKMPPHPTTEILLSMRTLMKVINQKFARDSTALQEQRPYWPATSNNPQYKGCIDCMVRVVDELLHNADFELYLDYALLQMMLVGGCALMPHWRVRLERHPFVDYEMNKKGKLVRKETYENRLVEELGIKMFPSTNYCVDPYCGFDERRATWAWAREYVSTESLKQSLQLKKLGELDELDYRGLRHTEMEVLEDMERYHLSEKRMTYVDYILFPNAYYMFAGGSEHCVHKLKYNPLTPGMIPLATFKNFLDPNPATNIGLSDNSAIGEMSSFMDVTSSMLLNILSQIMEGQWVLNSDLIQEHGQMIHKAGGTRFKSQGDIRQAAKDFRPQTVPSECFDLPQRIKNEIHELENINPTSLGALPLPVQKPTVVKAAKTAGDVQQAKRLQLIEKSIGKFGKMCAKVIDRYADDSLLQSILGDDIIYLYYDRMTGYRIDPDLIPKGIGYEFQSSSKANELYKKLATYEKLYNLFGNATVIQPQGIWYLAKLIFELLVPKTEVDKIMGGAPPPPPAPMPGQEQGLEAGPANTVTGSRADMLNMGKEVQEQ